MKKIFAASLLLIFPFTFVPFGLISVEALNPLEGKIIALDAGHGGDYSGAVNQTYGVTEKDVNLAVVYALKDKLEASGAKVVLTREGDETITRRKDRVDLAIEKCKSLPDGHKCDVLVSVHHNGSINPEHDGTMVIYNEKQDIPLATALHDALITGPYGFGLPDEGYDHGGYGMTVYGHLVSTLTEAYYITNNTEAQHYLAGDPFVVEVEGQEGYTVLIGERINQEADALSDGLTNYFNYSSENGGGKPDKCSPWPECKK